MKITFSKYQGAGNDFILLDNRSGAYNQLSIDVIQQLCDRRFGIGADGLIKINNHPTLDFEADYYNADGSKSFCGNGGRCAVAFSKSLGIPVQNTTFLGFDGEHKAILEDALVELQMSNVNTIDFDDDNYVLQTGSPHFVRFTDCVDEIDMVAYGQSIRYNTTYQQAGINVNIVEIIGENSLKVRTYERGVEDETLACGTGVTACAIAYAHQNGHFGTQTINIQVRGGNLRVKFTREENSFTDIWLIGPAVEVFQGTIYV